MQPLITIIIPVYKIEKYLDECVESVVNQTYKNLEIILVDDGSPDTCPQICDKWAEKDKRIIAVHKENGGVSTARNAGLKIAKGDYIGFIDGDDYAESDWAEFLLNLVLEYDADISRCSYSFDYCGREENKTNEVSDKIVTFNSRDEILETLVPSGFKSRVLWNKLYKKEILDGVKFNPSLRYCEDTAFNFLAMKNANKMVAHDLPKYHYRIFDEQNSSNYKFSLITMNALDVILADECCPRGMYYRYYWYGSRQLIYAYQNHDKETYAEAYKRVTAKSVKKPICKELKKEKRLKDYINYIAILHLPALYEKFIKIRYWK